MRKLKTLILGLALYVSTLLGGCLAAEPPFLGDPPRVPSPVLAATVLPYIGDGLCSAVVIEPNVLSTARHCVKGIGAGVIVTRTAIDPVTLAWVSLWDDVGLIQVEKPLGMVSPVSQRIPTLGEWAYVAGYGCDSTPDTARLGVRAVRYAGRDSFGVMWFAGGACHGDSGGGVFDADGALLGITVLVNTDDGPVSFIGVEPLAGVLDGLADEDRGSWAAPDSFIRD